MITSRIILAFALITIITSFCRAQEWEFAKEKDGIAIYTRDDSVSSFKQFKGEIELRSDVSTVSGILEDVGNFDEWDEDISEIRVLEAEKGKLIRYYVKYDVPWPFTDRDLCVDARITTDPVTGERIIASVSDKGAVPADPDFVRIENYWQKWTITPAGDGKIHLTLEGFADPAGAIPAWLANMAITDTPLNMLEEIRELLSPGNGKQSH